ncbi:acyl-CoA carboxylase epsilon subunit-like protein [Amycolatopsis sulphurea]|uniref:Acyl-CoA carboxylase epsilon subunit-like protein n=1 Tax=Amycolatopsis sulphurea TaxID=76022 RepID=A0A2A9FAF4_9PSEU|nr:acyl-CoA carboxylase subunit epsilon [Amycolatopsis sulphurea]PFG47405.1 acyl-CoA carboxylase epsilon subunit-like protein [Amycolatopsis sulphurea]
MSDAPLLRVIRGNPDDAELAALTAVVAAAATATTPAPKRRRTSWWNDRQRSTRAPLTPGEGAWRASALPH